MKTKIKTAVMQVLQLNDDLNNLVDQLIPIFLNFIHHYTRNSFLDNKITFTGNSGFQTKDDNNIIHLYGDHIFQTGFYIHVIDSVLNSGRYLITDKNDNELYVDQELYTEWGTTITVTRINYPEPVTIAVANLFKDCMDYATREAGIQSEKIGNYAVSYAVQANYNPQSLKILDDANLKVMGAY